MITTLLGYLITTMLSALALYAVFEYLINLNPTKFLYKHTELNEKIKKALSKLPKYKPTWFLPGPYLKLLATVRPQRKVSELFDRHIFKFPDGGQVALDFYPKNDVKGSSEALKINQSSTDNRPIVIVVPGAAGDSSDPYLVRICSQLYEDFGFRSVIANRRGSCGLEITGDYPLSWVRWQDMDLIIDYLKDERPDTKSKPLYMIGYSIGANFVQLYAGTKGELGQKTRLDGAIAVSAPYEMAMVNERAKHFGGLGEKVLLRSLKALFLKHINEPRYQKFLKSKNIDEGVIRRPKCLHEFDDNVCCMFFIGRKGADDLYDQLSGNRRLQHVEFPVLAISSYHDPIVDGKCIDRAKILNNQNLFYCEVRDGGHVTYPHGYNLKNYSVTLAGKWIEVIDAEK